MCELSFLERMWHVISNWQQVGGGFPSYQFFQFFKHLKTVLYIITVTHICDIVFLHLMHQTCHSWLP